MSRYVPNAEDSQCFQLSKMKKCEVDVKKEECRGCSSKTGKAGIFAMIAKISLPFDSCHGRVIRNQQYLYP